ncbi:MAG: 6-phosphogluconolactonase [Vulcanimicrobiaceae bacterium]
MLERRNLTIVSDDVSLARALAELVVGHARVALDARGRFDLALAGGSTPKAAYALLASAFSRALDWSRVRFFFGDERCVPPDDPASNYRTARETLLDPLAIDDARVLRMRGEDDPPAAARAYATTIRRELPSLEGTPTFDLVLLGMGPDGHTASLFPGSDPLTDDDALVRAPYVATFATHRLTLTPRVFRAARAVAVATAGDAKADALHAVFDGPADPAVYPIAILDARPSATHWLVDRAAAAKLAP